MPAAPPPTQNPPFSGDEISTTPVTPPTSPQRYQQAARLEERLHRVMGSPDQRRTPAGPLTLPAPAPQAASAGPSMHPAPAPQAAPAPLTFNGQTYTYLPPHLAAMVAGVVAFPEPPRRRRRVPPQPFPLPPPPPPPPPSPFLPPPPPPAPIGSGPALGPGTSGSVFSPALGPVFVPTHALGPAFIPAPVPPFIPARPLTPARLSPPLVNEAFAELIAAYNALPPLQPQRAQVAPAPVRF